MTTTADRRPTDSAPRASVSRGRGFWMAYGTTWVLYTGLVISAGLAEGMVWSDILSTGVAVVLPAAFLGAVVAARRRDFFRPDRTLLGMLGLHAVTGTLYAGVCSLLAWVFMHGLPPISSGAYDSGKTPPGIHLFYFAFLYVILAAFLMWTESIARVQESRAGAAREAMLRAQAEARAVRAQFNPHFVFNTLHSLMLLVRAEPDTAEHAIEDVAALIRYASRLQKEDRDTVPLDEELDFARRYLALEELRLEERLRVRWDVEGGLGEVPVPAFSLQTLLENAVKHGLAPNPTGGTIRVGARRREEGGIVLSVEDDGEGASPGAVTASQGQGLRLLTERVRVLYGDAGSVKWKTQPGGGFAVEISLPQEVSP